MNPSPEKLQSEMRRGAIVLAVLGQLRVEHYGYQLRKQLAEHGMDIEEGTLYPLIRRLEKQGLLQSEWREEGSRKKRFYRLSDSGEEVFKELRKSWADLESSMSRIIGVHVK